MSTPAASSSSQCPFAVNLDIASPHDTQPKARIVVGDRIKAQLNDERFVTINEAESLINEHILGARVILHVGQGTDYDSLRRLYASVARSGLASGIELIPRELPPKASSRATHKRRAENVLITEPRPSGHGSYLATLLLDDRCADMSDHLTGEHVPGMAIAEAARQMIIAVAEAFFIAKEWRNQLRFITHQMEIQHISFLLPIATELRYVPISLRRASAENMKLACEVQFIQCGRVVAVANFEYSTINRSYLEALESSKTDRLVNALCSPNESLAAH